MRRGWTALFAATVLVGAAIIALVAVWHVQPRGFGIWDLSIGTVTTSAVLLVFAWLASRVWNTPIRVERVRSVGRAIASVTWLASASVTIDSVTTLLGYASPSERTIGMLHSASLPSFVVTAIAIAILPALSEEALFRGAIAPFVERESGAAISFVTTSVLFGALHLSPRQSVQAAVLGFVLHAISRREGLSVAILAHAANNLAFACFARASVAQEPASAFIVGSLVFGGATFVVLRKPFPRAPVFAPPNG